MKRWASSAGLDVVFFYFYVHLAFCTTLLLKHARNPRKLLDTLCHLTSEQPLSILDRTTNQTTGSIIPKTHILLFAPVLAAMLRRNIASRLPTILTGR